MSADILREISASGVELAIGETGNLKVTGDRIEVERWLPKIRAHKPELLALLSGADPMPDNRRTCTDCMELVRGQCRAAARGELPHAARSYAPMPDRLHRCLGYRPGPKDADRRMGYERFPGMARKLKLRNAA